MKRHGRERRTLLGIAGALLLVACASSQQSRHGQPGTGGAIAGTGGQGALLDATAGAGGQPIQDTGTEMNDATSVCQDVRVAEDASKSRWPDSPTAPCASTCTPGSPGFGQDGSHQINVPTYVTNGDTVADMVTGLTWQRVVGATLMTAADAATYCTNLSQGSATDWRLPNWLELVSIVDYGTFGPAIPSAFTAPTDTAFRVWSSSGEGGSARALWPYDGSFAMTPLSDTSGAWCVRGEPLTSQVQASAGCATVRDLGTGLMWQRRPFGLPFWTPAFTNAMQYCEGLTLDGYSDWRLPSIKELASLIRDQSAVPLLDPSAFSEALPSYLFVSSTPTKAPRAEDLGVGVWQLDYSTGRSDTSMNFVISVDIQPISAWPAGPYASYARCVR